MRIFHKLAFDAYVNGTANVYSDPALVSVFGSADQLVIGGYTTQVSGAGPTLTVQVEHSIDNIRWQNRNAAAEVSALALSGATETPFSGQDGDPTTRPTLAFARLRITLGGASPAGQVRIWITGRDQAEG
ncbi:MAG TPA: hypothetical protein VHC69_09300 [Polyangiaceae bacterium]|nr:hypothetical protein [Polyangiaceae bacterium]